MRRQRRMWRAVRQRLDIGHQFARGRVLAHEVDGARERARVDLHAHEIAVAQASERAAGQGLGTDVPDTGPGGHARESRVGEQRRATQRGRCFRADVTW